MSLFDDEDGRESVSQIEYPKESGRSPLIMLPLLAAIAIIVALLLFFGGRWIYRTVSNDSPPAPNVSEQNSSNQTTTPSPQPASPTPAPQPTPSPTPSGSSTQSGSNLPNSGPGEVIALFITISAVAAITHSVAAARRRNRSLY